MHSTGAKISVILVSIICVFGFIFILLPPSDFPKDHIITIKEGETLSGTADMLADKDLIRSKIIFKALIYLIDGNAGVKAGGYLFDSPQSVVKVASRLANSEFGISRIKITIPEGFTAKEIAKTIASSSPSFDASSFISKAKLYEGYLFPDTYFIYSNSSPNDVLKILLDSFEAKMKTISGKISSSGKILDDAIIMASIIEKEASDPSDRRIISGILWKRLRIGMPLQVDASFFYYLNKTSSKVTEEDLKTDSPYNLYKNKGFPPTPISNPGMDSILAALEPKESKYWYYLSDKEGKTHYAITFEEHVANKMKYLR